MKCERGVKGTEQSLLRAIVKKKATTGEGKGLHTWLRCINLENYCTGPEIARRGVPQIGPISKRFFWTRGERGGEERNPRNAPPKH